MSGLRLFSLLALVVFCLDAVAADLTVKVIKVAGSAHYRRNDGKWLEIKPELKLPENCQIKTAAKTEVSLEIPGKGLIKIHELSFIKLDKLSKKDKNVKVKVSLSFGKIWNRFKKNIKGESSDMTVETPAAVAAVRGTSFYVSSEEKTKTAKIGVWEGMVEVKSSKVAGSKMVKANYEIIVLYNKPLQDPVKMAREASNRAKEFQQAIENMGMAAAFPAARGMVEINDMQTNQARDTLNKARMQLRGGEIVRKDFVKLKKAIARLYADTNYYPGKEISGKVVRKGARNSLQCLLKDKDRVDATIPNWKGPYLDSDLKDPFGGVYGAYYKKSPRGTEYLMLYSFGVDKMPGGNNDEETMYLLRRLKRDAETEKKNRK
ncbi:MAG: FecR domain-containing protein [Victivallales bacterium]